MPDFTQEVRARLSSLRLAPTREMEIVEELSQHLEERWREFVAKGASTDEATSQTLALFRDGDLLGKHIATLKQAHPPAPITPGASTGRVWPDLRQHVRYAARILWKQPGFAAVAVLTLALGIGSTTAIFSVVYGVLLKPLPFYQPDRLVALYNVMPAFGSGPRGPQSPATYLTYRENARVFEDIGLWDEEAVSIIRNNEPAQVQALRMTDGLLPLLGVRPELGRLITKDDDAASAPARVVLTHGYWQRMFGAARDVIGQSVVINAKPHEIIGVLPASFRLLDTEPQVVLPMRLNRANVVTGPGFGSHGVGRLKPGVTLEQANADVGRMIPLITKAFPLMKGVTQEMWDGVGLSPNVRPLAEDVIGEMSRPLWILLGTVGIVLLMAWANVANLLLVRAEGRQRELAVRTALGASRGRIAFDLVSESLMLGLAGGLLGIVFAQTCVGILRNAAPVALPRVSEIGIDGVVLLATLSTSIVTSLLFGLVPVMRLRAPGFIAFKEAGRSVSDAPGRHRTKNALVVAQMALALVLLVVSGLMARTFVAMRQVEPGFVRPGDVQKFDIALPGSLIKDQGLVLDAYEQIAGRLKQVPGVEAVGLASSVPMDGSRGGAPIFVEDHPVRGTPPLRRAKATGPGYFEAMGRPLMAGRALTWADLQDRKRFVIVSETFAREYWGEPAKALGRRIGGLPGRWDEIVGVAADVREAGLNRPAPALVYMPMADVDFVTRDMSYLVRSSRVGSPGFLRELEQAVWSVNNKVPLANVRTLAELQAASMSQTSFAMVMLAISASVALLLGVVGIYGVVRYIAAQRVREIGIRMALGAQAGDVRLLFLRHGLVLTSVGIAIGLAMSVLLTRVMSALLFGVAPTDPVTYIVAAIGLAAVAAIATYLPARRASATDPIVVLRTEA